MEIKVALGQMAIALARPDQNVETARALAAQAADQEVDLLILPELWPSGYDLARARRSNRQCSTRLTGHSAGMRTSSACALA